MPRPLSALAAATTALAVSAALWGLATTPAGASAPAPLPRFGTTAPPVTAVFDPTSTFHCFALEPTVIHPFINSSPIGGLTPANIQAAYELPPSTSTNTVAVIDAYDDPGAESDLAVYRDHYGLAACTTTNGCFTKVDHGRQAQSLTTRPAAQSRATRTRAPQPRQHSLRQPAQLRRARAARSHRSPGRRQPGHRSPGRP